jgi:membrane protease YdiL (CAAX protease family)
MNSLGSKLTIFMLLVIALLQSLFLMQVLGSPILQQYSLLISFTPIIFSVIIRWTLACLLWVESGNLQEFHVDRFTVYLFIFSSIVRIRSGMPGELVFAILIALSGVFVFILLILRKLKICETNLNWTSRGLGIGVLSTVLLFVLELLIRPIWTAMPLIGNSLISTTVGLMATIFDTAPLEEIVFRGFLWGYLRRFGWTESKIFFVQGILFWLCHLSRSIITPFSFFIGLPLLVFVTGKLVMKSKQLFPSILSHSIVNMLSKGLNLASI